MMNKPTRWPAVTWLPLLLIFCLAVTDGFCQDETPYIKLTRQQAIAMAISNNIDLRVRALDSSLAETDIAASKSIYNPYLNTSLSYSQTSAAGETYGTETTSGYVAVSKLLPTGANVSLSAQTGPTSAVSDPLYDYTDWSSSVGITVNQPLLKNAGKQATELAIAQDEYAHAGSLESFRNKVIDTVFAVVSDYNRLYVLSQLRESREAAVHSAQQLLEEIRTRPNPGDNPEVELSNTEYALSQRQSELIEAERQVSSKEADLRYLIGMADKAHLIPLDPPSQAEPQETEVQAIELALAQRPDLKELRISLASNQLREKVSKRNLWPDLALSASGGYRGYAQNGGFGDTVSQIGSGQGKYWSAGLFLNFPLGNDLAESEHRRNALLSEQLQNQITAAEWQVRDTIREDNRSLISARLQLHSTAKSKQLAEQRVTQYQKNRRRGAASVKDLLDAENDLIYARNLELNAIENFSYQVARLWKDIGVLLERQNVRIDTAQPEQLTAGSLPAVIPTEKPDTAGTGQSGGGATPVKPATPLTGSAGPVTTEAAAPKQAAPAAEAVAATTATASQARAAAAYTLKFGTYVSSELASLKRHIKQAGLTPLVNDGPRQERDVIRLLLGEYPGLQSAQEALEQLKNTHSGGFILKHGPRSYHAYAGSFFTLEAAESEQQRLAARGITLSLKKVSVVLPTFLLTAGRFSSEAAAMHEVEKLKQQGLAAEILPIPK